MKMHLSVKADEVSWMSNSNLQLFVLQLTILTRLILIHTLILIILK